MPATRQLPSSGQMSVRVGIFDIFDGDQKQRHEAFCRTIAAILMKGPHKETTYIAKSQDFHDSVRKQPLMYTGNNGAVGLLHGLIIDIIEQCKSDNILFEIILSADNAFSIRLSSPHDLSTVIDRFNATSATPQHSFPDVLKVLSKVFEIHTSDKNNLILTFSLDETILSPDIDYIKLTDDILQLALLNRQCQIMTIDKRRKYVSQNYYHFPEGVLYLFDRTTKEVLGKPEFNLTFEGQVNSNTYQIGIAYRFGWYKAPTSISFANDVQTIDGGSLVDGILAGLTNACKKYMHENDFTHYKVSKKKLMHGLVLVCAVRGENLTYGGSFRETLEDTVVKRQANKIMQKLTLDYFKKDQQSAARFLTRFDESHHTGI